MKGVKIMSNQLTTKKATALLKLDSLDISKPADFAAFVAQAQALQNVLEEAWGVVEQQMIDRRVTKVQGDWGQCLIATRRNWKATGKLAPRFYKQVLDTAKINFMFKNGEKLPKGVSSTTSNYLTRKLK